MGKNWLINEYVRKKLRRLRLEKGLTAAELAHKLGVPRTSYVSMESGAYNIKLDHVYRALAVLEADILDVWPQLSDRSEVDLSQRNLLQIQEFRLNEVLSMSDCEGGILLVAEGKRVSAAMVNGLSDYFVDRLAFYLEEGVFYEPGKWFKLQSGTVGYFLYLRTPSVRRHVEQVIDRYMAIWATFFGLGTLPQASNDR